MGFVGYADMMRTNRGLIKRLINERDFVSKTLVTKPLFTTKFVAMEES